MDAAKLLEVITIELKLARTLLEAVRTFMPKANLSTTENACIESEFSYLEGQVQARRSGEEKARRKKRKWPHPIPGQHEIRLEHFPIGRRRPSH